MGHTDRAKRVEVVCTSCPCWRETLGLVPNARPCLLLHVMALQTERQGSCELSNSPLLHTVAPGCFPSLP